ncbi:copper resistance CopC family protein [Paractinoplanes lichenicola]|uniref:Copper resistance protein CopC n=1 Tax=Paractinoplanes lichenicola TaxID=2802976 RepID=A0ABS1VL37_9ACTN|nr:copper resistance protein CopC [Actinoplanes lichenicola]MBL7255443.1 copper resistance protein CopC [Actinoplanes lichenicola]
MRSLVRGLLALGVLLALVFGLPASPASAHGTLAMSNPVNGATVAAPLGSVELYFTEKVRDDAYFAVTAPDGGRVDNGWEHASPRPLDKPVTEYFMENGKFEPREYKTGFPARVRIAHLPATGEYKVEYRSTASDGDQVHGTVTFKYTGPTTPAPAGWAPPGSATTPAKTDDNGGGINWLAWAGGAAGLALVAAAVVVWRRRGSPLPRLARIPVAPVAVGGVVVALIGGYALGRATVAKPAQAPAPVAMTGAGPHQHGGGDGGTASVDALGTAVSDQGYTIQPVRRSQPKGSTVDYTFRIVGADKQPATRYSVVHDKPLHLVVVGRGLTGFQHLHPTMAPDGLWSVPLTLPEAGAYRVFADFTLDSPATPLVLGVDHFVPGDTTTAELPAPQTIVEAKPFLVSMEGDAKPGATTPVLFRVARSAPGPVTLERYLGSYGHLVVLREGDLGYVHVHPDPELTDGAIRFNVSLPGAARYRAFLEFQVDGKVHRAEFTLDPS